MSGALTNLVAFIVAISVLVAVHEFGHYIVGRWCGMKVLRFSIGFGKPIWTWIGGKDRTEYCLSNIPLGGYVKFLDEREGPVDEADRGRAFNHRPIPARIVVLLAGPAFNFLFALVAYWVLSMQGVPTLRPVIGEVQPDSYAAAAGLESNVLLIRVGDQAIDDWGTASLSILDEMVATGQVPMVVQDVFGEERAVTIDVGEDRARLTEPGRLFEGLGFMPGQPLAAGLESNVLLIRVGYQAIDDWGTASLSILDEMVATGQVPMVVQDVFGEERAVTIDVGEDRARLTEPGRLFEGLGFMPGQPLAIAEQVTAGAAAEQAGMLPGDRIISVNGEDTLTFNDMAAVIVALPDRTVPIGVVRDGLRQTLYVDVTAVETADGVVGRIGIASRYLKQFGAVAAVFESFSRTAREATFTVRMLWNMVTREVSIKNISGPISIAQFVGDSARAGFSYVLTILALISISLGVLNLLPIPMLDGGQIVYQTVEWIKGSPMSDRAQMFGQQVGILAILLLMSFAFYNDIARLLS